MPHTAPRPNGDMHYAALQERVHGLGQQFLHFEQATTRNFQQMEAALAALSAELRAGGKTQWQTIVTSVGVIVTILAALGTLAYLPVKSSMDQLSGEVRLVREGMVPRAELVQRWARTDDDLRVLAAALLRQEDRSVTRHEHDERARSADRRHEDLQRQIDDLRRAGRGPRAGDTP